jgi:2,3-bisphosphoglycerate-independent phosphoglycerate mutase
MKYVILQADGMPDHPLPELGNKTPLEVAHTPNLDKFAQTAIQFGLVKTIPDGLPPGSDVGNLSVLGYNPIKYYTGRSPLEAASIGVKLAESDVSLRCNLVTLAESDGKTVMEDYSAGHISTEEAKEIIFDLKKELEKEDLRFFPGVSYRHLLIWSNGNKNIITTPPHDIPGKEVSAYFPSGGGAGILKELIEKSKEILRNHPINKKRIEEGKNPATSIWLWGQGTAPNMPTFNELYGITGSVISAVDLVKGIGYYAGLNVINVPGATGYLDTNYEGKVEYALNSLKDVDLTMIHIESTDETGHVGDAKLKIQAIEDFDSRVLRNVLEGIKSFNEYKILILSDHPTPIDIRTHVNEPVPYAICSSGDMNIKDRSLSYTEKSAFKTNLFVEHGWKLMSIFLEIN